MKAFTGRATICVTLGMLLGTSALAQTGVSGPPDPRPASQRMGTSGERGIGTLLPPVPGAPDQAPSVTTLSDAVALAYRTNPALLSSRDLVSASDERLVQARANLGPSVNVEARYQYNYGRIDNPAPLFGGTTHFGGWNTTASLIFSQPVFASGRLTAGIQAGQADVELARQQARLTENDTLLNIYSNYVGVLRDRALVIIAQQNLDTLEKQYTDNETRFKVREITRTDLDQIETRREVGRTVVLTAAGQLSITSGQFLQYVGALPGDLQPAPPPFGMPQTLNDAQYTAEQNSPLLLGAHARERGSRALVKQAEATFGPTVSLEGQLNYIGPQRDNGNISTREAVGGVVLRMPLYDSGQRYARAREARLQNQSDWRLIEDALRQVHQAVERSWDSYVSNHNSLPAYQKAVDAAQRAYDGAVEQQRAGARTTLDVLDLLRDLLNARSDYARAQAATDIARASLLAAMGTLEVNALVPQGLPYDPSEHLDHVKGRGDTLVVVPVVEKIDGVIVRSNTKGRPYQDPAAGLRPPGLTLDHPDTAATPATPGEPVPTTTTPNH